jgi:hypothetical protein
MTVISLALACGALSACSTYVFPARRKAHEAQSLNLRMASIDASYQASAQKIVAEQHLSRGIEWVRRKPRMTAGGGCDLRAHATGLVHCDVVERGVFSVISDPDPAVDPPPPTAPSAPARLRRADLLRALDK